MVMMIILMYGVIPAIFLFLKDGKCSDRLHSFTVRGRPKIDINFRISSNIAVLTLFTLVLLSQGGVLCD